MSVLINMEMPKEPDEFIEIAIFGDGKVIQTGESWRNLENGKCYYTPTTPEKFFNAVPVPPHRLIDREQILDSIRIELAQANAVNDMEDYDSWVRVFDYARKFPTIIPASEEEAEEET